MSVVDSGSTRPPSSSARPAVSPGWIRTALGGPDAPYTIKETVPKIANVLLTKLGRPGLDYLDRNGETVPW